MKISDIAPKDAIQTNQDVSRDKRAVKSEDFRAMFQGELNALTEAAETSKEAGGDIMAVGGAMDMAAIWKADALWNDMQTAATTARAVGEKLDTIGQMVGDETAGLKGLEEMIGELSKEANELQEKVKDLPQDHPLRGVSDELSVLAYVESVKWKRGDYL